MIKKRPQKNQDNLGETWVVSRWFDPRAGVWFAVGRLKEIGGVPCIEETPGHYDRARGEVCPIPLDEMREVILGQGSLAILSRFVDTHEGFFVEDNPTEWMENLRG